MLPDTNYIIAHAHHDTNIRDLASASFQPVQVRYMFFSQLGTLVLTSLHPSREPLAPHRLEPRARVRSTPVGLHHLVRLGDFSAGAPILLVKVATAAVLRVGTLGDADALLAGPPVVVAAFVVGWANGYHVVLAVGIGVVVDLDPGGVGGAGEERQEGVGGYGYLRSGREMHGAAWGCFFNGVL